MKTRSQTKSNGNEAKPRPVPALEGAAGDILDSGKYRCPCGKEMGNTAHIISSHISKHHPTGPGKSKHQQMETGGKTWCPACRQVLENPRKLVLHFKKAHKKKMGDPEARDYCPALQLGDAVFSDGEAEEE
ncbi:hypothetical protein GGR57DRAFT_299990 [Xylariaceae sp. FL1272]|nr:hypothetical protein GGR57DRAFT_299990 [Xylariaceae sp. FL1272]